MTYPETLKAISIHAPHAYIERLKKVSEQEGSSANLLLSGIRPDITYEVFMVRNSAATTELILI